jgi:hypothetical protein
MNNEPEKTLMPDPDSFAANEPESYRLLQQKGYREACMILGVAIAFWIVLAIIIVQIFLG